MEFESTGNYNFAKLDYINEVNYYNMGDTSISNPIFSIDYNFMNADLVILYFYNNLNINISNEIIFKNLKIINNGVLISEYKGEDIINYIAYTSNVENIYTNQRKLYIESSNEVEDMSIYLNDIFAYKVKKDNLANLGYEANCMFLSAIFIVVLYILKVIITKLLYVINYLKYSKMFCCFLYFVTLSVTEYSFIEYNSGNIMYIKSKEALLNIIIYLLLNIVIYSISNLHIAAIITGLAVGGIGLLNSFVLQFRGTPILPWDIYSIGTALNVSGQYKFDISWYTLISVLYLCIIIYTGYEFSKFVVPTIAKKKIFINRGLLLCATVLFGLTLLNPKNLIRLNVEENVYRQVENYQVNGWGLGTVLNLKYIYIEKPTNFSKAKIDEILSQFNEVDTTLQDSSNIIIILNESFADLQKYYDIKTNAEVMPFVNSLTGGNVAKGVCYVSQFGGGTCNTEYELLMGNTTAFMPVGSIIFQQHIKEKQYSLINILNNEGYSTISMHPAYGDNWNRTYVYPLIGFEESYFIDDLEIDETDTIRDYTSDNFCYNWIIEQFNEKSENDKVAIYCLTIQNHGGYLSEDYEGDIKVLNGVDTEAMAQYLSLINESDKALEQLFDYFSDHDEKVVILFMGDHQPALTISEFYENDTSTNIQNNYAVPYILWNNYDEYIDIPTEISINYMATYLLKNSGIRRSKYYLFLDELSNKLPVINSVGFKDFMYRDYAWEEESNYKKLIDEYQILQYGIMSDDIIDKDLYYQ